MFHKPVGKRGFAVVDMRYNAKIAYKFAGLFHLEYII